MDYTLHSIKTQKNYVIREEHSIKDKGRIIAGMNFYGKQMDKHVKIINDVRDAIFDLKAPNHIKDIVIYLE